MAAIVASVSIDFCPTFAGHQTREQVVIPTVATLTILLLVSLPENRLCLFVRYRGLMSIAMDYPFGSRPIASVAYICTINEFLVAIPDSVTSVGEGAVFDINQTRVRNLDSHFS